MPTKAGTVRPLESVLFISSQVRMADSQLRPTSSSGPYDGISAPYVGRTTCKKGVFEPIPVHYFL